VGAIADVVDVGTDSGYYLFGTIVWPEARQDPPHPHDVANLFIDLAATAQLAYSVARSTDELASRPDLRVLQLRMESPLLCCSTSRGVSRLRGAW
jgi:hypothetical protein